MSEPCQFIGGISHVNLTVPVGTLPAAKAFYEGVLELRLRPGPSGQTVLWFDCGNNQELHVAYPRDPSASPTDPRASRHPCFRVLSPKHLAELREKIYASLLAGGEGAPMDADKPGEAASGAQGADLPERFFARDFAGNRLEFSV